MDINLRPNYKNDDTTNLRIFKTNKDGEKEKESFSSKGKRQAKDQNGHPLNRTWKFWFVNPPKKSTQDNWEDCMRSVASVSTVEEFWSVYNEIPKPSELPITASYCFFEEGIEPKWEDPANKAGGKFQLFADSHLPIDSLWEQLLFFAIGELCGKDGLDVAGLVITPKRKISLWTRTATDKELQDRIEQQFRSHLKLPSEVKINFRYHKDYQ
eukprot:GCRY01001940.1.p1 GENE.GCRY01001940.1~~GCRY01001940.1.p1  ORF type:complete len:212 (+),score=12.88 GCRY01001940.1:303-938(+)